MSEINRQNNHWHIDNYGSDGLSGSSSDDENYTRLHHSYSGGRNGHHNFNVNQNDLEQENLEQENNLIQDLVLNGDIRSVSENSFNSDQTQNTIASELTEISNASSSEEGLDPEEYRSNDFNFFASALEAHAQESEEDSDEYSAEAVEDAIVEDMNRGLNLGDE